MVELETNVEEVDTETEDTDDVDYKALYETEKSEKEKALADADKRKGRFKKSKADENNTPWLDQDAIKKMVDDSVWVVKFYSENKDASQYQEDIEALVAKGIDRNKAFRYVVAEKDPSLLLDDAKKAQLMGNTALNWVPTSEQGKKNPQDLSDDEISKLSDKEFDELFPAQWQSKKFYAE